jgi:hypothetical protein
LLSAPLPLRLRSSGDAESDHAASSSTLDIKKLGQIDVVAHRIGDQRRCERRAGWEHVYVAADDEPGRRRSTPTVAEQFLELMGVRGRSGITFGK